MSLRDIRLAKQLDDKLTQFNRKKHELPGIRASKNRQAFIAQLIDSVHRIRYVLLIRERDISPRRADPSSDLFDPLKAAIWHHRQGNIDEAYWLVFLSVHFGKNLRTGWRLVRDIYGSLGNAKAWDWARISTNPAAFRQWLAKHQARLKGGDGVHRHFGNHRKYQSLDANSRTGTGEAIESYIRWVNPPRTHVQLVKDVQVKASNDPRKTFDGLYHLLHAVTSFGRMAKFDYLTMLGKMGLAPIEPGSTYMLGATGPFTGSKLLFCGSTSTKLHHSDIEKWLEELEAMLGLPFGMQVLEDAICNWQKSPSKFKRFRG